MKSVIGIDYTAAYEQGAGIGRYVRELVNALAQVDTETSYRLFVAGVKSVTDLPALPGPNFEWRTTPLTPRWLFRIWHRARLPIPIEYWLGNVALFHATDFVLPPVLRRTRTLLTVHDLSFVHLPEATSPALKRYLDQVVPRSVRTARRVLADSEATKTDLVTLYGTSPDKVTVLLSGVNARFKPVDDTERHSQVRSKYGLGEWPFMFTIGTVQPRKNYARLCAALHEVRHTCPDLHLVIAGGKGWLDDPIYEAVDALALGDRVHFIGFADDDDLPTLYSMAEFVPYVSLYEGFGLPVLEAMACGTPVIASNVSSMPEVAGEAALMVDPTNSHDIASAIQTLMEDSALRGAFARKGLAQSERFTWERAASELVEIYREMLS